MSNVNIAGRQMGDEMGLRDNTPVPLEFHYEALASLLSNAGSHNHVGYFDDFLGDTMKAEWATDLSTSSTATLNQQAAGAIRLTTHTDDNANATLCLGLHWLVSSGPIIFRARVKQITAITLRGVEIGLSDALSETNGQAFTSHTTPTAVADDAALFGFNHDDTSVIFSAVSVNGGGTEQGDDLTAAPSTAYSDFSIVIDAAGNAYFYTGQTPTLVATHALAVATTALLTPWISITNLTATSARAMDVDYVVIGSTR